MEEEKKIAKYMGFTYVVYPAGKEFIGISGSTTLSSLPLHVFENGNKFDNFMYPKYDTSLDALLPVLEKIETSQYVDELTITYCSVYGHFASITPALKAFPIHLNVVGKSKHDVIFKLVIEYIDWYNEL